MEFSKRNTASGLPVGLEFLPPFKSPTVRTAKTDIDMSTWGDRTHSIVMPEPTAYLVC